MNDVLQRVSGESQPVPLWRTASTEDLENVKEKEIPLLYSFRLNLKVGSLKSIPLASTGQLFIVKSSLVLGSLAHVFSWTKQCGQ